MRIAHRSFIESGDAKIVIVYQKEPHAGQMAFGDVAQPESLEERIALAKRMKDEIELPMTVLVDTMEDQSRALFSDLPSPAFVIDRAGVVRAKFPWAEGEQITAAVAALEAGEPFDVHELEVHVVESGTGSPIEGAEVFTMAEAAIPDWGLFEPSAPQVTDARGDARLSFEGDPSRTSVVARAPGFGAKAIAAKGPTSIELSPEVPVTVEVVDFMGRPVSLAFVGVALACGHTPDLVSGVTDRNGRVTLRGLARDSGTLDVYVVHERLSREESFSLEFPKAPGEVMRICASPGRLVDGIVVTGDGEPVPNVGVGLPANHRGPWTTTNERGEFRLLGVRPRGSDLQVIKADGSVLGVFPPAAPGLLRRLEIFGDEPSEMELRVSVIILQSDGPLPSTKDIPVEAYNLATGAAYSAFVSLNGVATMKVPKGRYRLMTGGPGTRLKRQDESRALGVVSAVDSIAVMREIGESINLEVEAANPSARYEFRCARGEVLPIDMARARFDGEGDDAILLVPNLHLSSDAWALWQITEGDSGQRIERTARVIGRDPERLYLSF